SEARVAALLNHPNLVHIFDFGEADGTWFLAMEFIDGLNLRVLQDAVREGGEQLPCALAARMVASACEGLAHAHALADPATGEPLNLVHRDISPDNVLVSRTGVVKVVDFGIAKAAGQAHKTKTGGVRGKVPYMSPEQLASKPLDPRADVYALGVVLYELLAGALPYEGEGDAGLMKAILFDPPVPLSQRRGDVPALLREVVERALSRKREERFENCTQMQEALEKYLKSEDQPSGGAQLAQWVARWAPVLKLSSPPPTPAGPFSEDGRGPAGSSAGTYNPPSGPGEAAVLFTDIVGSTRYFEQHGDQAGLAMVQRHNGLLFPHVARNGGRVVKTIGDAIFAEFPDADRAVRAALAMQETLEQDARSGNAPIHVRMGLHAGQVVRQGGDVFGDVVNTAARINAAAQAGEVLVSREVLAGLQPGHPPAQARPAVAAKGKSLPVEIYALRDPVAVLPRSDELSYFPCTNCGAPLRSAQDFCMCQAEARLEAEAGSLELRSELFDLPAPAVAAAPPPREPAPASAHEPFDVSLDDDGPLTAAESEAPAAYEAPVPPEDEPLELGFDPRKERLVNEARAEAERAAEAYEEENPEAPPPAWKPPLRDLVADPLRKPGVRIRRQKRPLQWRWVFVGLLVLLFAAYVAFRELSPESLTELAVQVVRFKEWAAPYWESLKRFAVKGS
ncbi:MAG: hypothetical protein RL653_2714, partial [Pseudomonadota bacterium]